MNPSLTTLKNGDHLNEDESYALLKDFFSGNCDSNFIADCLRALSAKGEHYKELLGFTNCLRDHALPMSTSITEPIIDVCGTGGSDKERFNISTCVTFVLAAGDVYVAKHGNYGSKKANGSFNFLDELGINYDLSPDELSKQLERDHYCFLFARKFHPAMRFVGEARQQLKQRSIFNLIGPLANPLKVPYQIIGLSSDYNVDNYIRCIQELPIKKVTLCIGGDGRDEVSLSGITRLITITPNNVSESALDFQQDIEAIDTDYDCGDSSKNAAIFKKLLAENHWKHPIIKHIAINAALAFVTVGRFNDIKEAYRYSLSLFESGAVQQKL